MAIVEKYYNNDRARNIRELINQNFANVARYIPNNFVSLTTTERQNLTEDYITHFKLAFDKEVERIYRWSDVQKNWKQYLIYARDEYAREEANNNSASAFFEVQLGVNASGNSDPYTFTFYSREYDEAQGAYVDSAKIHHDKMAKGSVTLTAANVKFNNTYSVQTIIQKLIDDLKSLDDFVGDRDDILQNSDLTQKTVAGAIKEVNNKTINNKNTLDNILNGITKVPEAIHAEHSDLADIATLARDSEKLGGQLPSYYAKQSDLNTTNETLADTIERVTVNESNIEELKNKTDITNRDLANLSTTVANHYAELQQVSDKCDTNAGEIGRLVDELLLLDNRLGWEILMA